MSSNSTPSSINKHRGEGEVIAHDIVWNARKIPLSYSRHITGHFVPGGGRSAIPFESHLERSAIAALVNLHVTQEVVAQPVTVTYSATGSRRTYTPDLFVRMDYVPRALSALGWEMTTLVEVKPACVLNRHANRIRFKLRVAEIATGLAGVCLTENDFPLLQLASKEGAL